ncbi:MAG: hypothetical protein U1E51_28025 [Candidatus Binatia bacterium]|nr:hypothetical protein [Candidatus Binatia bacterium]
MLRKTVLSARIKLSHRRETLLTVNKTDTHAISRESVFAIPKGKKRSPPDPVALEAFGRFYAAYPRRVARGAAERAWAKINPNLELAAAIVAGAEHYAAEVQATDPRYIAHPATWLNSRRWEDEPSGQQAKDTEQLRKETFVNA